MNQLRALTEEDFGLKPGEKLDPEMWNTLAAGSGYLLALGARKHWEQRIDALRRFAPQ